MHVVSVCLHCGNIIWLPWQRPLTDWKIKYRSIICTKNAFIWWKYCENPTTMSADIQRNMPVFWPCRTWRSQMSSIISGVTRQMFTKFLHDIATSSSLLAHTFIQWYCNSFSNNSAKNASGISRHSLHFPKISWLSWQRPGQIGKQGTDISSALKVLSYCEKIVKIGPLYPEIFD